MRVIGHFVAGAQRPAQVAVRAGEPRVIGRVVFLAAAQVRDGRVEVGEMPAALKPVQHQDPGVGPRGRQVLVACRQQLRGDRLKVDMTTGVSRVESDSGRVQGLFQSNGQGGPLIPGQSPPPAPGPAPSNTPK